MIKLPVAAARKPIVSFRPGLCVSAKMESFCRKVAVIGAGGAGLACARHLSSYPHLYSVSVFERADEIGGTWLYTDRTETDHYGIPVHSSVPKSMRTNLPKEMMHYPDFPFGADHLPSFVGHADILDYLKRYARHYDLYRLIAFHTLVEKVEPRKRSPPVETNHHGHHACSVLGDDVNWMVRIRDLETGRISEDIYDVVVVCVGHYSKPYTPRITGLDNFPGQITHSHTFRTAERFAGRRVLVVGTGNSGNDILGYLVPISKAVYMVYSSSKVRYKLPSNSAQFPPIKNIASDGTVTFENGESKQVDDIILCTGYEYNFPFLGNDCGVQVMSGRQVTPLYKHTFNIVHPSMGLMGINYSIVAFPFFHVQAQLILSVLLGKTKLPSRKEMERERIEKHIIHLENGFPPHHTHKIEPEFNLIREFVEFAELEPLSMLYERMDRAVLDHRAIDLWNFRKYDYRVTETSDGEVMFSKHVRAGETLV